MSRSVYGTSFYSFVLVVWESTRASAPPDWQPIELCRAADGSDEEKLRVRRCSSCGKYRVLPRHQSEPPKPFTCSALADPSVNSCAAPYVVWKWA
jgi:hypothetical protein